MHKYSIDNLSIEREFLGLKLRVEVSCDIEITTWMHTPADPGVPYNGGENAPEPSYPESWDIQGWEVLPNTLILWISYQTFDVMEIDYTELPEEEKYKVLKIVEGVIADNAPWETIEELFNEYMR